MNKFGEAIPDLEKALQLKPENLLARRLLAHCHIKLKNQKEATDEIYITLKWFDHEQLVHLNNNNYISYLQEGSY